MKIKFFEGVSGENPKSHLDSLEGIFTCWELNESAKVAMAASHLKGEASYWWQALRVKPDRYESYKKAILEAYWREGDRLNAWEKATEEQLCEGETTYAFAVKKIAKLREIRYVEDMEDEMIIREVGKGLPIEIRGEIYDMNSTEQVLRYLRQLEIEEERKIKEKRASQIANLVTHNGGLDTKIMRITPKIKVRINEIHTQALFDSGSQISVISTEMYARLAEAGREVRVMPTQKIPVMVANGKVALTESRQVWIDLQIGEQTWELVVLVMNGLIHEAIIGTDFMDLVGCKLDFETRHIIIKKQAVPFSQGITQQTMAIQSVEIKTNQGEDIDRVLEKYKSVFAERPGKVHGYEHRILLTTQTPFQTHAYPIPFQYRDQVNVQLRQMLEWGVISKCSSPYNNPVLIVKKKIIL